MAGLEETSYCQAHCSKCFKSDCPDTICPLVDCVCKNRLHECKLEEHQEQICGETEVDCPIARLGCPMKIKRRDTLKHLAACPANTVVCGMRRMRLFEKYSSHIKHLHPRDSEQVHLYCYVHDLALMRRSGRKASEVEDELRTNPCREELESLINGVRECGCTSHDSGAPEVEVRCEHVVRRGEAGGHRESYLCLSHLLKDNPCPMRRSGCQYRPQGIELGTDRGVYRFDTDACGLVVEWEPVTSHEVDYDQLSCLPYIVLGLILQSLDSFSLRNLSMASKYFREVCFELLYTKGVVTIEWESNGKGKWYMGRTSWSFSKVSTLPSYRINAKSSSDISRHLQKCKYYEKERVDYRSLPEKVLLTGLAFPD